MMKQNGSESRNSNKKSTRTDVAIDSSGTFMNCLIEALMEEIMPVVTDKYGIESQDKSVIIKNTPQFLGLSGF